VVPLIIRGSAILSTSLLRHRSVREPHLAWRHCLCRRCRGSNQLL